MSDSLIEDEPVQLFKGHHAMARPVTYERGAVRLGDGRLQLLKSDEVVAEAPLSDVHFWQPKLFMGDGVKVDLGAAGAWTVTPARNGLFALGHAKRWTRQFIDALRQGGAQQSSGS